VLGEASAWAPSQGGTRTLGLPDKQNNTVTHGSCLTLACDNHPVGSCCPMTIDALFIMDFFFCSIMLCFDIH
jgi:hypothetical protein